MAPNQELWMKSVKIVADSSVGGREAIELLPDEEPSSSQLRRQSQNLDWIFTTSSIVLRAWVGKMEWTQRKIYRQTELLGTYGGIKTDT